MQILEGSGTLIQVLTPDFEFRDDRGTLLQLVHEGYKQVNVVFTRAGVFRGGHYHKENVEVFYVTSGSFDFTAEKDSLKEKYHFKAGDMFAVMPGVIHGFEYTEDSEVVALYDKGVEHTDGTMDSYPAGE